MHSALLTCTHAHILTCTPAGNEARYCRRTDGRTGEANAVIRHHLEKGSLHLYIVASRNIDRNQEILLPRDHDASPRSNGVTSMEEELQNMRRAEVRAASTPSGNGTAERRRLPPGSANKRRVKRENVKKKELRREEATDSSSSEEEKERPPSPRKTRSAGSGATEEPILEKVVKAEISVKKEEVEEDVKVEEEEVEEEVKPPPAVVEKKPKVEKILEIVIPKEEIKKEDESASLIHSPMKSPEPLGSPSILKSPVKPTMGLPDQTGLIVGVNTINYDVSFRNKSKTREEKKMEMIMKAIEAMERAEARKRTEGCDSSSEKPEKKRRRSNSTKTSKQDHNSVDSNLDASSADESSAGGSKVRAGKGRGKRSSGLAARRRSRAKSGDSSALSDADGCTDITGVEEGGVREFKFPRYKRLTGGAVETGDVDDDVSRQYLRGSRSPPGIANHLLRSSSSGGSRPQLPDNSKYARQPSSSASTGDRSPAILSLPRYCSSLMMMTIILYLLCN